MSSDQSNAPGQQVDLCMVEVAIRLRKSKRWLQAVLAEDRRRPHQEQRFQFHEYLGRSPRWTEVQFLALRAARKAESRKERLASQSLNGTTSGTSPVLSSLKDAQSALERVLTFQPEKISGKKPTTSGSASRRS